LAIKISHLNKLFTCFHLTIKYRHALAVNKTYMIFMDYWYLLRYTVIIYKFTQGNLGAKKIARIRFQSPVKKKNRKLRHWRTDSATPEWLVCGYDHHMIVGFISTYTFSAYHHWSLWVQFPPMMYHLCDTNACDKVFISDMPSLS
jgi:hypothetical protein